jgi:Na+/proline symporter
MTLSTLDITVIVVYIAAILGIGFYVKRRAARGGLESYFLGGRALPWWMIAMSGSSSYFDITGTMWIVSLVVVIGMKAMWIQWIWCFVSTVFFAAYMGKWIRRSGVMTGSEWMVTRFGAGRWGDTARLTYTIYAVLTLTAFLGYTAVGMGKFGSVYFPELGDKIAVFFGYAAAGADKAGSVEFPGLTDKACATIVIAVTGIYVIVGGFEGLILVELLQTTILTIGAILIAVVGAMHYDPVRMAAVVPADWWSIAPVADLPRLAGTSQAVYMAFGAIILAYVANGLLIGLSGPPQLFDFQRFLATRNPRDASKMGALWGVIHTVRWPMVMGIAILALMARADKLDFISQIEKDSERALPAVIAYALPLGMRGLAIAALIAAFVSTFNAMVNGGASYIVKDIYQRYIAPDAPNRRLIAVSYLASIALIIAGIVVSWFATSINAVFAWIMGSLGAGVVLPNILRWYWWRTNGQGYAAGTLAGMALSLLQVILASLPAPYTMSWPIYYTLPAIALSVCAISVIVSLATAPTDMATLAHFYRTVQPGGFWGPVRQAVLAADPSFRREHAFAADFLNVILGIPWMIALYLAPMYAVGRHSFATGLLAVFLIVFGFVIYFTWYKRLPTAF